MKSAIGHGSPTQSECKLMLEKSYKEDYTDKHHNGILYTHFELLMSSTHQYLVI